MLFGGVMMMLSTILDRTTSGRTNSVRSASGRTTVGGITLGRLILFITYIFIALLVSSVQSYASEERPIIKDLFEAELSGLNSCSANSNCAHLPEESKQPVIYIFVSFSMNDAALQAYYKDASKIGATLVIRGLVDNSFNATKDKLVQLNISCDIDPELFTKYAVKEVPVIIRATNERIDKITGHIDLASALQIFDASPPNSQDLRR